MGDGGEEGFNLRTGVGKRRGTATGNCGVGGGGVWE
jgi:hypothetical protein